MTSSSYLPKHVNVDIPDALHSKTLPASGPSEPMTGIQVNDVDTYLAQTLNQMSIDERNKALDDVHGIATNATSVTGGHSGDGGISIGGDATTTDMKSMELNDPAFIPQSLQQLDDEIIKQLSSMSATPSVTVDDDDNSSANRFITDGYKIAITQGERYVQNHRLMFLRCESYNITRAAIRMISYFDFKLRLFGRNLFTRDVKISDLDKDTQICLESGYFQILPQRDRSGRAICLSCLGLSTDSMTPIQKVSVVGRLYWYKVPRGYQCACVCVCASSPALGYPRLNHSSSVCLSVCLSHYSLAYSNVVHGISS